MYFNPRTRAGCDNYPITFPLCRKYFNPRTRAGCDQAEIVKYLDVIEFQSTHPCRVRPDISFMPMDKYVFQSTHPCRVRRFFKYSKLKRGYFNPRTRAGCDTKDFERLYSNIISIHAPVQGATSCLACLKLSASISIHAPVQGATHWLL